MNDTPLTDQDRHEDELLRRHRLAVQTENARAALFGAMLEQVDMLRREGIPEVEAPIMTGAVEAATQLWAQVAHAGKIPRRTALKTLRKEVDVFFTKHWDAAERARKGLPGVTVQ